MTTVTAELLSRRRTVLVCLLLMGLYFLVPTIPARASTTINLTPVSTNFNTPIGADYYEPTNKVLLSVNYSSGEPNNFDLVGSDGTHSPFTSLHGLGDEVYIATVRSSACHQGFQVGESFTGNGQSGQIVRISPDGSTIQNPWVTLPGETGLLAGGLFQDRYCTWGGDLIVTTRAGDVWRVTAAGAATMVGHIEGASFLEGPTTIPDDPAKYGPWAGNIVAADESSGCVWSIDHAGASSCFRLGMGGPPESVRIIDPNENFFGVDYGDGTLMGAEASQFTGIAGDVLLADESPGLLIHIHWNGTTFETEQVAQVAQWEGTTFAPAGIPPIPPVSTNNRYREAVTADEPSAYFEFEDSVGSTTFHDSVLSGPPAQAVGTPSLTPIGALSKTDGGLKVGGDGYATIAASSPGTSPLPELTGANDRTVELWFRTGDQNGRLFTAGVPTNLNDFEITLNSGSLGNRPPKTTAGVFIELYGDDIYLPDQPLADNKWHYLALTLAGQNCTPTSGSAIATVFVDNKPPNGALWDGRKWSAITAQTSSNPTGFKLPHCPNTSATAVKLGGPGFTGSIDEVAVYPKALSLSALSNHYGIGIDARSDMKLTGKDINGVTNEPIGGNGEDIATLTDGNTNVNPQIYTPSVVWNAAGNPTKVDTSPNVSIRNAAEDFGTPLPVPNSCDFDPRSCSTSTNGSPGQFIVHGVHTYRFAGDYHVQVMVARKDGSGTASVTVIVHIRDRCGTSSDSANTIATDLGDHPGNSNATIDSVPECFQQPSWDATLFKKLGPDSTYDVIVNSGDAERRIFGAGLGMATRTKGWNPSFDDQFLEHERRPCPPNIKCDGDDDLSWLSAARFGDHFLVSAGVRLVGTSPALIDVQRCALTPANERCARVLNAINTSVSAVQQFVSKGAADLVTVGWGDGCSCTNTSGPAYARLLRLAVSHPTKARTKAAQTAATTIYNAVANAVGDPPHHAATFIPDQTSLAIADIVKLNITDFAPDAKTFIGQRLAIRVLLAAYRTSAGVARVFEGEHNYANLRWNIRRFDLSKQESTVKGILGDIGDFFGYLGGALERANQDTLAAHDSDVSGVWSIFGVASVPVTAPFDVPVPALEAAIAPNLSTLLHEDGQRLDAYLTGAEFRADSKLHAKVDLLVGLLNKFPSVFSPTGKAALPGTPYDEQKLAKFVDAFAKDAPDCGTYKTSSGEIRPIPCSAFFSDTNEDKVASLFFAFIDGVDKWDDVAVCGPNKTITC